MQNWVSVEKGLPTKDGWYKIKAEDYAYTVAGDGRSIISKPIGVNEFNDYFRANIQMFDATEMEDVVAWRELNPDE